MDRIFSQIQSATIFPSSQTSDTVSVISAFCRCPAAAPRLDSRCPCPPIHSTLIPQHGTAVLRRTIQGLFLGLRYPWVPAHIAYRNTHCLPAHAAIVAVNCPSHRTQLTFRVENSIMAIVHNIERCDESRSPIQPQEEARCEQRFTPEFRPPTSTSIPSFTTCVN